MKGTKRMATLKERFVAAVNKKIETSLSPIKNFIRSVKTALDEDNIPEKTHQFLEISGYSLRQVVESKAYQQLCGECEIQDVSLKAYSKSGKADKIDDVIYVVAEIGLADKICYNEDIAKAKKTLTLVP